MKLMATRLAAIIVVLFLTTSIALGACGVNLYQVNLGSCGLGQSCWVTATVNNPCNIGVNVWATLSLSVPGGGTKIFSKQQWVGPKEQQAKILIPYGTELAWPRGTYQAWIDVYPFDKISRISKTIDIGSTSGSGSTPSPSQQASAPQLKYPPPALEMPNGCNGGCDFSWLFIWTPVSGATKYHLTVKHQGAATAIIDDYTTSFTYQKDMFGYVANQNRFNWQWKVSALVNSRWIDSPSGTFNVQPMQSSVTPPKRICDCSGCPYGGVCNNVTGECYCNPQPQNDNCGGIICGFVYDATTGNRITNNIYVRGSPGCRDTERGSKNGWVEFSINYLGYSFWGEPFSPLTSVTLVCMATGYSPAQAVVTTGADGNLINYNFYLTPEPSNGGVKPPCDCSGCPYGGVCNNVTGECYCNPQTQNPQPVYCCGALCPKGSICNQQPQPICNCPPCSTGGYCDEFGQCICPAEPEVLPQPDMPPEDCPVGCFYDWNVGGCACPPDESGILGGV